MLDVNNKESKTQWIRNMHAHLTTSADSWTCPICGKYVGRTMHGRHGEACLGNSSNSSLIYQWYKYDNKYVCLVCMNAYPKASDLVGHLLDHHESDLNVFGITRYILARVNKDICKDQEA